MSIEKKLQSPNYVRWLADDLEGIHGPQGESLETHATALRAYADFLESAQAEDLAYQAEADESQAMAERLRLTAEKARLAYREAERLRSGQAYVDFLKSQREQAAQMAQPAIDEAVGAFNTMRSGQGLAQMREQGNETEKPSPAVAALMALQVKYDEIQTKLEQVTRSRHAWESDAHRHAKNADLWKTRVEKALSSLAGLPMAYPGTITRDDMDNVSRAIVRAKASLKGE